MNKIKLVIEMPEDVYTRTFDNGVPISLADGIVIDRAIRTGTVLPDKHGRLIDADRMKTRTNIDMAEKWIDFQETILEADKAERSE